MPAALDEAALRVSVPGGPFEIEEIEIDGRLVRAFCGRHRSIGELVESAAGRRGREFLVDGDTRLTFSDFARTAWGVGTAFLAGHGLRAGDRVAILAPNCIEWITAAFGTAVAGGVAVGLNVWWSSDEVRFALGDCGARFLVVHERLLDNVLPALDDHPEITIFVVGTGDALADPRFTPFSDLFCEADSPPGVVVEETDPFALLYTSGTTGHPKACITTHGGTIAQVGSMIYNALLQRELEAVTNQERLPARRRQPVLLATSPFFHVSGLHAGICSSLATGTKVVLYSKRRIEAEEILELIEHEQVTAWGAVPTLIQRVAGCPHIDRYDLSSLESVAIGGAPIAPGAIANARAALGVRPSLGNGYGLTETHGAITMNAGRSLDDRPGSVGRANVLVDLRIVGETGDTLLANQVGEVQVAGIVVTPGYWGRPDETAAAIADGWFHTGDVGYLDDSGYLYLVDRIKDIIIRGGENVHSVEVEHCLESHPAVLEAAVYAIADDDLGERVAATVVLKDGSSASEADLRTYVTAQLARFKVPDRIDISPDPLTRNAVGKLLKSAIRSASLTGA